MDGRASFERDVAGIRALVDPVRRQLYQFVCSQSMPVSRDQAADAVGIPRHQAKFHLDRLTAEGLLDTEYARLTGRSGPGAGRTAVVSPGRPRHRPQPSTAGVRACWAADGRSHRAVGHHREPTVEVLNRIAHDYGQAMGAAATTGRPQTPRRRWS